MTGAGCGCGSTRQRQRRTLPAAPFRRRWAAGPARRGPDPGQGLRQPTGQARRTGGRGCSSPGRWTDRLEAGSRRRPRQCQGQAHPGLPLRWQGSQQDQVPGHRAEGAYLPAEAGAGQARQAAPAGRAAGPVPWISAAARSGWYPGCWQGWEGKPARSLMPGYPTPERPRVRWLQRVPGLLGRNQRPGPGRPRMPSSKQRGGAVRTGSLLPFDARSPPPRLSGVPGSLLQRPAGPQIRSGGGPAVVRAVQSRFSGGSATWIFRALPRPTT